MARTPIIAGNWKMNKGTAQEASALATEVAKAIAGATGVEIVVCPPYTTLALVAQTLGSANVGVGAQDVFFRASGAYTGQVAASMIVDAGARYVIIGHSEARGRFGVPEPDFTPDVLKHFGETDKTVGLKTRAALATGLTPIVCIGETLTERENGDTDLVVQTQVAGALDQIPPDDIAKIVLAYEPVWAIGTGKTCSADEADRVCGVVRQSVAALTTPEVAEQVRIQYGGSMKPDNAPDLLARPNIDGGLIGGASLKASDFAAIVQAAA